MGTGTKKAAQTSAAKLNKQQHNCFLGWKLAMQAGHPLSLLSDPSFFLPEIHQHTLFPERGQQDMAFSTGLRCHAQCKSCQCLHVFDVTKKENQLLS